MNTQIRRLAGAVVVLVAAALLTVTPSGPAGADTPSGAIGIRYSDWLTKGYKCLDVRKQDGWHNPNARVQLWSCSGAAEQQWRSHAYGLTPPAGEFNAQRTLWQIINLRSNMCLEVRESSTASGALVDQYPCLNGSIDAIAGQLWLVTAMWDPSGQYQTYTVSPWNTARYGDWKCLDAVGGDPGNGTLIQQWSCTGRSNQAILSWGSLLAS